MQTDSTGRPNDSVLGTEVQNLFLSAARLRKGAELLFPRKANNHLRPGEVRKLFGLSEHEYSNWRREGWRAAENTKQIQISQLLIKIFSGRDYTQLVDKK